MLAALRVRALECVAELSSVVGADGAPAADEARRVVAAMTERLWRDDHFIGGTDQPAVLHANVLALAFGDRRRRQATRLPAAEAAENAERAAAGPQFGGFLELYFLKFALDGLVRHGARARGRAADPRPHGPATRRRRVDDLGGAAPGH